MKKRVIEMDILRGLGAVLVVLGHSFITHPINIVNIGWCRFLHDFIYSFHMPLFFFVSGFVYSCKKYNEYIFKKIRRLLIPYLFFGTVSLFLHVFGGGLVGETVTFQQGVIKLFLYGGDYWFLYTLFLMFAIYPCLSKVKRSYVASGACLLIFLQCFIQFPPIFTFSNIVYYFPYFILGDCIKSAIKEKPLKINRGMLLVLAMLALLVYIGAVIFSRIVVNVILKYLQAFSMIGLCLIFARLLVSFTRKNKRANFLNRFLLASSKYSMQIYLFNGYLLTIIRIILCSILGVVNPVVIVLALLTGNLVVSLALCEWVIPYIPVLAGLCGLDRKFYKMRREPNQIVETIQKTINNDIKGSITMNDLVSIITPAYNCANYIGETIKSVLSQTYENWEMIIVDDCSTDNTEEVVKGFADERIKYLKNKKNSGAALSRNYALREAKGRWIAFLDSDDMWMPEKLEHQIAFMEENGYHFSCTKRTICEEDGTRIRAYLHVGTCKAEIPQPQLPGTGHLCNIPLRSSPRRILRHPLSVRNQDRVLLHESRRLR